MALCHTFSTAYGLLNIPYGNYGNCLRFCFKVFYFSVRVSPVKNSATVPGPLWLPIT